VIDIIYNTIGVSSCNHQYYTMGCRSALVGAMLAGTIAASSLAARAEDILKRTPSPMTFNCAKEWVDETLFSGTCPSLIGLDVNAAVDVNLGLSLPKGAINGEISIGLCDDFISSQTLSIDLSGFQAYVELDVSAGAAVYESIELVASGHLALEIPDLVSAGIDAGLAIDLIVGVSAAIELETGFYLSFPENSVLEISLATNEIVSGSLDGVIANALPIGLGLDVDLSVEIELQLGLRLRTLVSAGAGVNLLGLSLGAGLEAAVYVSLFDYTQVIVATPECPLSVSESFCIEVGIAVGLDVEVGDVLDISLAPSVHIGIAAAPTVEACLPTFPSCTRCSGYGDDGDGYVPPTNVPPTNALPGMPSATSSGVPGIITNVATTSGVPAGSDLVPTTIFETSTYTVTQCALTVANCPAGHTQKVITSTVKTTVTYCPASETGYVPPVETSPVPTYVDVPVPTETRSITLTECPATTTTYVPPSDAPTPPPTVVLTDSHQPTRPVEDVETPSATFPGSGASSSQLGVYSHSAHDCVGCMGPVTGTPSSPHTTGVPPAGAPPAGAPPAPVGEETGHVVASSSMMPYPSGTYVPLPNGVDRVAAHAVGVIVAAGAIMALL
jgi:hypothetical protein